MKYLETRALPVWAGAVTAASLLTGAELLKAHRAAVWDGGTAAGWLGMAAILLAYALPIGVAARILARLLHRVLGRFSAHAGVALGACGVWLGVAALSDGLSMRGAAVIAGLLAAYVLSWAIVSAWRGAASGIVYCVAVAWAMAAGAAALAAVNDVLFLSPERVQWVTIAAPAYTALAALLILAAAMSRRGKSAAAVALAVLLIPAAGWWAAGKVVSRGGVEEGPRLVLITCDALRAEGCSLYGGPTPTPVMESLAREGALFERCYSLAPWTLPSMLGLFGSMWPPGFAPDAPNSTWVASMERYGIPPDVPTLAQAFQAKGYATGGYTGNLLLTPQNGMMRGIAHTGAFGHRTPVRTGCFGYAPALHGAIARVAPALAPERPVDTTRLITRCAAHFINQHRMHPFFLWLHYMDPHSAYDPPAEYRTLDGPRPVFCNADPRWGWTEYPKDPDTGDIALDAADRAYVDSLYWGEVRYVDANIGQVEAFLGQHGLRDRTLFCVTSDHGEEFWEHGRYGHGHSLCGILTHVPCILRGPGITPRRVKDIVSAVDLMPTLAALTDMGIAPAWRGRNLAPHLRENATMPAAVPHFIQATNPYVAKEPQRAVIDGDWKLVRGQRTGNGQLYNLAQDPQEEQNRYEAHPDIATKMQQQLDAWAASFPSILDAVGGQAAEQPMFEQLRQLGYL